MDKAAGGGAVKRQGNLFDKIAETENLHLAARKALRGKKFKASGSRFYFDLENEILRVQRELRDESYCPAPYKVFRIYEPKERVICCAAFSDRVVHHGVINIIEPFFERRLIDGTYACRTGKGTHAALRKARQLVRKYDFYLKCDIRKCFDSIGHGRLIHLMEKLFKDKKLIRLLGGIISHQPPHTILGKGLPIGNLTSQHFANIHLGELDLFVKHTLKCRGYVRYMDDFILFANDKRKLGEWRERIDFFLAEELGLELNSRVVRIAPVSEGLPFLGWRTYRGTIRLQRRNLVRFRRKIAGLEKKMGEEERVRSMGSVVAHASAGNTLNMRRMLFG